MKKKANQQKLIKKKNNNGHDFLLKIINSRSRNISGLDDSNTIKNKNNINMNIDNTLFKNYRNISCKLRNKREDINSKNYNIFSSSINKNYYKSNNNDLSYLFNKNKPNSKSIRKSSNNHNE